MKKYQFVSPKGSNLNSSNPWFSFWGHGTRHAQNTHSCRQVEVEPVCPQTLVWIIKYKCLVPCKLSLERLEKCKCILVISVDFEYSLMSTFRLYVPTMLVIGLHGWILPPGAILVCDLFVYSEFLIHPLLLLIASSRLRNEIATGYKAKFMVSFIWIISRKFSLQIPLFSLQIPLWQNQE